MKISFVVRGFVVAVASLALMVGVVSVGLGQGGRQQLGNSDQIEKEWKRIKFEFQQQASGSKAPDAAHLDIGARYFVYRVTWTDDAAVLGKAVSDFNDIIDKDVNGRAIIGKKEDNTKFKAEFAKQMVSRMRELTELPLIDNARSILHGAQMFPALGRLQQEEVGVYLQELIDEKASRPGQDALRLYALRGLSELLPVGAWGEPQGAFVFKAQANITRKERDLARIEVVNRFILRPPPTPPTSESIEAYRYLRREGIETLARCGWPAVNSFRDNAGSKVEGPIALTLMKVLVPGNVNPPASLAERNEAALGLCMLKGTASYDGRPTLPYIAQTLVDMNKTYSEDKPNISTGQSRFAWKIEGTRWKRALENLVDSANGPFSKDAEGRKMAEKLVGNQAAFNSATGAGDEYGNNLAASWLKHTGPVNTLKVEAYAKANEPKGAEIQIFKDVASPTLKIQQSAPAAE